MIFLLWLACSSPFECDAERPCGFGEICAEGACEAGGCATSTQCPMAHHCVDGTCASGCAAPSDCYPGDTCNGGVCELARCEDTQLDCDYREFCDELTGECYDAGEQYCRPCDRDADCGDGNECWNHHCGVDCSSAACPAGFTCYDFVDDFGNVVAQQCLTYCWLYEDFHAR